MSDESNRPIIIKRKKVSGGGGHHGGAWKVAYADFVTAMMAFFMLMWLLNATTEKQRKGLADYFTPTIAIARVSGGGSGALSGDSMMVVGNLPQSGQGGIPNMPIPQNAVDRAMAEETAALEELATGILGKGGDSLIKEMALDHIITDVTDEGLVVEVFDLDGAPLFDPKTGEPTKVMREISEMLVDVFSSVINRVSVSSHSKAYPSVLIDNPAWTVTTDRAHSIRELLVAFGLSSSRLERVTGYGESKPLLGDAMDVRNNRLEVTLLREKL